MAERKNYTRKKADQTNAMGDVGRMPPQAVELETAVLGACLIEKDAFGRISEVLNPTSFYEKRHETIYSAIVSLAANDQPIDVLTVANQLKASGDLEAVGGVPYLAELSDRVLTSAHLEYHAKIIAQKALARELIAYASRIQGYAFDEGSDVAKVMQEAEKELFELSKTNQKQDFTQINPVISEAYAQLQKAAEREDGLSGLSSGFPALDKYTNGWQKSDLIVVAARPAMGKTAFVLSMAKNMAVDQRVPVGMFTLEMSNVQLVNRLIVNVCEIEGSKIRSGQLLPHEWSQLDFKLKELIDAPFYVDETPQLSVFELRTKARRMVREFGVQIIMIDYLQLMNASGMGYNNRQEEVSTISRSLKSLAKELNIPIIALAQLNRSSEKRVSDTPDSADSKRPQLSDLRESGAIEQDADMVCIIHRPEYYKIYKDNYNNDLHGIAEIIIAKHRNGAVGDVRLRFESQYARFSNLDNNGAGANLPDDDGVIRSSHQPMPAPPDDDDPLAGVENIVPF